MNINLKDVYHALQVRAVGHTTVMLRGTENYDMPFFLVAHTNAYARELKHLSRNKNAIPISIHEIEQVRGTRKPIVFDHWTIQLILQQYMKDIENKNSRIAALQFANDMLVSKITEIVNNPPITFWDILRDGWTTIRNWFK